MVVKIIFKINTRIQNNIFVIVFYLALNLINIKI